LIQVNDAGPRKRSLGRTRSQRGGAQRGRTGRQDYKT